MKNKSPQLIGQTHFVAQMLLHAAVFFFLLQTIIAVVEMLKHFYACVKPIESEYMYVYINNCSSPSHGNAMI